MSASEKSKEALAGAGFSSFCFATGFSLYFQRAATAGRPSSQARVDLNCDWRLGSQSRWANLLSRFPVHSVEPAEPVQAAVLAALRWSPGSSVRDVRINGSDLEIAFENGESLVTCADPSEVGTSWQVTGEAWLVTSEGGSVVVHRR